MIPTIKQFNSWATPTKWVFWSSVVGIPSAIIGILIPLIIMPKIDSINAVHKTQKNLISLKPGQTKPYIQSIIGEARTVERMDKITFKTDKPFLNYQQCFYDVDGAIISVTYNPAGESELVSVLITDPKLLPLSVSPLFTIGNSTFQQIESSPYSAELSAKDGYYCEMIESMGFTHFQTYLLYNNFLGCGISPKIGKYMSLEEFGDLLEILLEKKDIPEKIKVKLEPMRQNTKPNGWAIFKSTKFEKIPDDVWVFDSSIRHWHEQ